MLVAVTDVPSAVGMTRDKKQIKTAILHYEELYLALLHEKREALLKLKRNEHERKEMWHILMKLRDELNE